MMLLRLLLAVLATISCLVYGLPSLPKRDVPFEVVPSTLWQDHSGRGGDPEEKYWHESTFHIHYDGRFAQDTLPMKKQRSELSLLIQSYLSTMQHIGTETWLVHGTLLGWWWNRRVMPWDSDLDVMISERSMTFLSHFYNLSIHHFEVPDTDIRKQYMLEINPFWTNASTADWMNTIDARWIDTNTGLFIDITTLRKDVEKDPDGSKGLMMIKDKHHYLASDIFPLRDSVFEGRPVKIPFAYTELLYEEYGPKSLTRASFKDHRFVYKKKDWIPNNEVEDDENDDAEASDEDKEEEVKPDDEDEEEPNDDGDGHNDENGAKPKQETKNELNEEIGDEYQTQVLNITSKSPDSSNLPEETRARSSWGRYH